MANDKFTAIVVGAGPAGSTAALVLARAGHEVLLIEKGAVPGAKNMFGGRLYSHALNRIIPEFWERAPVERPVVRETLTLLHDGRSVSLNVRNLDWVSPPHHSFTLHRAEFDAWLASEAEEAGAMLACSIRVDDLLMENGRVIGIRAGEDEMFADVVIAADGVNSLLAQRAGLAGMASPRQVATGVKQIIELPSDVIRRRFQLEGNNGAAQLFVGDCTGGMQGGGFVYTNRESVSLGLVINANELRKTKRSLFELIEDFKMNPHIAPLLEGGDVGEYSAHLIPEAGLAMMPRVFGQGILVAGDAAGFALNLGYVVRGMDFAIASGEAAAKTVIQAKKHNDFSRRGLSFYQKYLRENFVLRDLAAYRRAPEFMENCRLFETYPDLITSLMAEVFTVSGSQPVHLFTKILSRVRQSRVSLAKLFIDGWRGATWL
jgi:electron transfer flavoprotein-quinone oxidoreductase